MKSEATTLIFCSIKERNDGNFFTTCFIEGTKGLKYTWLLYSLVRICFYLEKVSVPIYYFKTKYKSQMKENVKNSFYCILTLFQVSKRWYLINKYHRKSWHKFYNTFRGFRVFVFRHRVKNENAELADNFLQHVIIS